MRHYLAYSLVGVLTSRLLQKTIYKNSRAHWIRDCLAGYESFSRLHK